MEDRLKLTLSEVLYQKYKQVREDSLFCRVPKSNGTKFIRFSTEEMNPNVSNNGMIVSIDPMEQYSLLDRNGKEVEKIRGVDLYNSYYEYLPFLDGERKNLDKKSMEEESKIAEENKKVIARLNERLKTAESNKANQAQKQEAVNKSRVQDQNPQKESTEQIQPENKKGEGTKQSAEPKESEKKVYSVEQFKEIRKGIQKGLDVSKYKAIDLNHLQMKEIRLGLETGLDVSVYDNPSFDANQMREMRLGLKQGFDMKKYRGFNGEQLREIRLGLDKNLDVSKYTNKKLNPEQMKLIRTGLQAGLDVTLFNNECFDVSMMKKIHTDLMVKKIVDVIKDKFLRIKESITDLIDEAKVAHAQRAALISKVDEVKNRELGSGAKVITELMAEAEIIPEEQAEETTETIREELKTEYDKVTDESVSQEEVSKILENAVREVLIKIEAEKLVASHHDMTEQQEVSEEDIQAMREMAEMEDALVEPDEAELWEKQQERLERETLQQEENIMLADQPVNEEIKGSINSSGIKEQNEISELKKLHRDIKELADYKPLAKVEELEEANYNMIDNVLNNEKPRKEKEGKHDKEKERISMKDKLSEMKEKSNEISRNSSVKEKSHEMNM